MRVCTLNFMHTLEMLHVSVQMFALLQQMSGYLSTGNDLTDSSFAKCNVWGGVEGC